MNDTVDGNEGRILFFLRQLKIRGVLDLGVGGSRQVNRPLRILHQPLPSSMHLLRPSVG